MEKHLQPPHNYIYTEWKMNEIREAVEKTVAALLNLSSISTSTSPDHDLDLINLASVENLFVVYTTRAQEEKQNWTGYVSYGPEEVERGGWEWGSRDMMFDLGDDAMSSQQRMAILTTAANLTDKAVHLLLDNKDLTQEEEWVWVEALSLSLSLAADRDAGPTTLTIQAFTFRDAHTLLRALKKNKRLKHFAVHDLIGAGKSTLISTMRSMYGTRKRDKYMRPLFATEGRTRGIEVGAIEREGIRVSLWDMAGQSEFHAFHDCMFPDIGSSSYQLPSMFMFVWSPIDSESSEKRALKNEKSFEASFRYWLRFLASKSRQSNITLKVMVVFTRADQMASLSHAFATQIGSLQSDFEGLIDILDPPFHVDARKKDSIKAATSVRAVTKHIFDIAKRMLQGNQVYNICTDVNKLLTKHLKKIYEEIITWKKFSEICYSFHFPTAKLEAIALCLNESGNIIYINGIRHMVLNPNWFCNQVMGSLIHFSNSKASKSAIVFTDGCTSRDALEECLESVVKSKVKGLLLVNLMEAMHLCCKVEINNGVPNSHVDRLFIPALLTDRSGLEQLQWRSSTKLNVDEDTFVYMGRRLECEDKKHTFLTPGLFPRVQVLFNKAFQSLEEEYEPNVMLGKDFISICFSNKEIIIVFCQAKSEHVIDVLVRANNPNNSQRCHASITLADVELKHVINTLVTICAQPTGIHGVKLIESVIRPECLRYPSRTIDREDQCVPITNLRQQLKKKLERGEQKSYDFIDLLGSENYEEVLMSCKLWIKEEAKNPLLSKNDEVNVSMEQQSQHNVRSSEHSLLQEDPIQGDTIEVQSSKLMVKAIRVES